MTNGQSRDTGNIGYTRHKTKTNKANKRQKKPKGQTRMDNPETLATQVTQIFHNGQPSHGGDGKTFEVMTDTQNYCPYSK